MVQVLAVYADEREGDAVAERHRAFCTGVGKVVAAARVALAIERDRPAAVVSFGVCGAYPAPFLRGEPPALAIGEVCVVDTEWLADEGKASIGGFIALDELGLGPVGPFLADDELCGRAVAALGVRAVAGATVSTCSGTDAHAEQNAYRSEAHVESMEGAAVASVCADAGVPWLGVRCVSNLTGDSSEWELELACERVQAAVLKLLPVLEA